MIPETLERLAPLHIPEVPSAEITRLDTLLRGHLKLPSVSASEATNLQQYLHTAIAMVEGYCQTLFYDRQASIKDEFNALTPTVKVLEPWTVFYYSTLLASGTVYREGISNHTLSSHNVGGQRLTAQVGDRHVLTYSITPAFSYDPPKVIDNAVLVLGASMWAMRLGEPVGGRVNSKEHLMDRSGAKAMLKFAGYVPVEVLEDEDTAEGGLLLQTGQPRARYFVEV